MPYGEDIASPPVANDRTKFATYHRDASGYDYADQRYYSPGSGRFLSGDPYLASGGPSSPGSWNRYAYVEGDPINWRDPHGMDKCPPGTENTCIEVIDSPSPIGNAPRDNGGGRGSSDPKTVLTRQGARNLALSLVQHVKAGHMNDCQALAGFAGALGDAAGMSGEDNYDMVDAFAVLTPSAFVPLAATNLVGSVATDTVYLGNTFDQKTGQGSGYASIFQDSIEPTGDRGHHFAAFFQLGFNMSGIIGAAGGTGAWLAALRVELSNNFQNAGDIELGFKAAVLGVRFKEGTIRPQSLANHISTICQSGPQKIK